MVNTGDIGFSVLSDMKVSVFIGIDQALSILAYLGLQK